MHDGMAATESAARRRITIALAFLSALAAASCATVLGFHEPIEDVGDDGSVGPGDGGGGGGGGGGGNDGPSLPEGNVADCGAAPRTLDGGGLFVAAGGRDTGNTTCSMETPCATLGAALAVAARATSPQTIYVAAGTYTGSVDLVPGVRVEGGWVLDAGWSAVCDSRLVTLAGNADYTVRALDAGTTSLAILSVLSKPAAGAGETLYGVWAAGATVLTLDGVAVGVASGGDGPDAPQTTGVGTNGANCDLDSGPADQNGQVGGTGKAGVGSFGPNGYDPGTGEAGSPGGSGTPGPGGPPNCIQCGTCQGILGICTLVDAGQSCGQPGTPACGGGGGPGGAGAQGGGSSIAIYAWGANVNASNAVLVAANGGKGGTGAAGGAAGTVTPGTTGQPGQLCTVACSGTVGCSSSQTSSGQGGAPGTAAGSGGLGGPGGGGQGGWSVGVYAGGDAGVTVNPSAVTIGNAGTGGTPNGGTGQAKKVGP